MGYRIEYGSPKRHSDKNVRSGRVIWLTGAFLLIFTCLTMQFWPQGRELLEETLLPGDPTVTKQAFSELTQQLRQGEAVGDAVAAFCREVIDGAALTD